MTSIESLVVYEPDGLRMTCTDDQARRLLTAWNSLLRWLEGHDPDELPESDVVRHVVHEAALRRPPYPKFEVRLRAEHARKPEHRSPHSRPCATSPVDLTNRMLTGLHLERTHQQRTWLNRVAIELLYAGTPSFQQHRHIRITHLLDSPVLVERWTGQRLEHAHAIKFLVHRTLAPNSITHLVHMTIMTTADATRVLKAVEMPPLAISELSPAGGP